MSQLNIISILYLAFARFFSFIGDTTFSHMNKFWPARSKPKGFAKAKSTSPSKSNSIDFAFFSAHNLGEQSTPVEISEKDSFYKERDSIPSRSIRIQHWANRAYEEYHLAA